MPWSLHAPVEGGDTNEAWWAETLRIQALLPLHAHNLYFVDANGRLGSSCSEAVGSVMAEAKTVNGWLFHQWLLAIRAVAFSTFRAKGECATWRSSTGHLRRIDYVCGDLQLLERQFDTWVDREIDVATVRDDNFPAILNILWQPDGQRELEIRFRVRETFPVCSVPATRIHGLCCAAHFSTRMPDR
jgi:hypothetical protein